ncbi:MAG: NUDIX hydrolase, partial [Corynebacterium casei]
MIESIFSIEISKALEISTRQYLVGNLARPQELKHIPDADVEIGISRYESASAESPHYHDEATEFQYMISGWTRYKDLGTGQEFDFTAGDFYVIKPHTHYVQ